MSNGTVLRRVWAMLFRAANARASMAYGWAFPQPRYMTPAQSSDHEVQGSLDGKLECTRLLSATRRRTAKLQMVDNLAS